MAKIQLDTILCMRETYTTSIGLNNFFPDLTDFIKQALSSLFTVQNLFERFTYSDLIRGEKSSE